MKLQVADDAVFCPDVFVTCDPADLVTEQDLRHPLLVAEVRSDSTQAFDRGLKFAAYRRVNRRADADADWPRMDKEHRGLERPGGGCRSASG